LRSFDEAHTVQAEVIRMLKQLLLGAGLALTAAACATQPTAQPQAASAAPTKTAGCVASSPPSPPNSCAYFGSTHSQEDLRQIGTTGNIAQALQKLDPSVQAR
jgi:hypothetical protein